MFDFTVWVFEDNLQFWVRVGDTVYTGSEANGFEPVPCKEPPPKVGEGVYCWCGLDTSSLEASLANCSWEATLIPLPPEEGRYLSTRVWVPSSRFTEILKDFWYRTHNKWYCPPTIRHANGFLSLSMDERTAAHPKWSCQDNAWGFERRAFSWRDT